MGELASRWGWTGVCAPLLKIQQRGTNPGVTRRRLRHSPPGRGDRRATPTVVLAGLRRAVTASIPELERNSRTEQHLAIGCGRCGETPSRAKSCNSFVGSWLQILQKKSKTFPKLGHRLCSSPVRRKQLCQVDKRVFAKPAAELREHVPVLRLAQVVFKRVTVRPHHSRRNKSC